MSGQGRLSRCGAASAELSDSAGSALSLDDSQWPCSGRAVVIVLTHNMTIDLRCQIYAQHEADGDRDATSDELVPPCRGRLRHCEAPRRRRVGARLHGLSLIERWPDYDFVRIVSRQAPSSRLWSSIRQLAVSCAFCNSALRGGVRACQWCSQPGWGWWSRRAARRVVLPGDTEQCWLKHSDR